MSLPPMYEHGFQVTQILAKHSTSTTDPLGYTFNCYTPLIAYITDLSKQQLMACVPKNASPITAATLPQFGDPEPREPCTGQATLEQIKCLYSKVNPWDIINFQKKVKLIKLLGVHLPFWWDWRFADPAYFLMGEILHTCHKFFFNHILAWCKEVAGKHNLNTQYKTQHQCIGVRYFQSGVSHVKQMTG
ncbi:hypothetical protein PAXRUDRAFT_10608 [Paxillus rubicundulus Ve08.2h10]|uniref:Unplaced genomic scaffold scaffold_148, whole genome shotgun sequence n=1 Tax=Paxillus rubicundulus Ve08.2h10 TaxID=930991 RepID=A0A0D0E5Q7_9AGAM|nr:hypothetical protein PAXRUDRAFT_10608 [Paxillus rubicundulus Ve08.2h10]